MTQKTINELKKMIDVNIPIIYINDYDFVRIDELIEAAIGVHVNKAREWSAATGVVNYVNKAKIGNGEQMILMQFLKEEYEREKSKDRFIILRQIEDYIDLPEVKTALMLISQRKLYDLEFDTTIIIVSSQLSVPEAIKMYVSYLTIPLPDEEEIKALIEAHVKANKDDGFEKRGGMEELKTSLKGMTAFEIDRTLDMAMSKNGNLTPEDKEMINQQKKHMVKNSGVLELIDTPESIESIGGVEKLKDYLKKKSEVFKQLTEAERFGVATPKGVFLVGMPGCGKSLCAKATATQFGTNLLKLDMGSMMGKYVGESEGNLRKAIRIAEAAAPCILWIDEIEKAFSGIGGNNDIMTRMFGHFLSWMQEKKSPVYVFATANNADKLPPELKRKGRFDEIFCVNLPNQEERKDIFKVHIGKKKEKDCKIEIEENDYGQLAKVTEGFNGADIEAVVNEAVERCFLAEGKDRVLTSKIILEVTKDTKSIYRSCKAQIEDMEVLFSENDFTNASKDPYWVLMESERNKRIKEKKK